MATELISSNTVSWSVSERKTGMSGLVGEEGLVCCDSVQASMMIESVGQVGICARGAQTTERMDPEQCRIDDLEVRGRCKLKHEPESNVYDPAIHPTLPAVLLHR